MKRDTARICGEICEYLLAAEVGPTARCIRTEWLKRYGEAPSFTDILPHQRKWISRRKNSRRVKALVRAYRRLDLLERESVDEMIAQINNEGTADAVDAGTR